MSRPIKQGLDYFPMDVDLDDKFELLEAKFGLTGFAIIVKLYQRIYKEGYFLKWNEETALLFSKRIGAKIDVVNDVVNDAIKYKLFDKSKFTRYKVLTSVGIQKRFCSAISRRKEVSLDKRLIIIDVIPIINVDINWINVDRSTQSKVKESKGEKSKEKEPKKPPPSEPNFIDKIIEVYVESFPDTVNAYSGKNKSAAGGLLKTWKSTYPDQNSEDTLNSLREFFMRCKTIPDKWYCDNMSLPILDSKFTEIGRILTNPKRKLHERPPVIETSNFKDLGI